MSLIMYEVFVRHPVTREVLKCLGQGTTVQAALADAGKVLHEPFRPKQDGGKPVPLHANITLADGRKVLRSVEAFESGKPYTDAEKPVVPTFQQ